MKKSANSGDIDYRRHGSRYKARRRAADILFEAEARDVDPVAIVEDREKLSRNAENAVAPVASYTRTIVEGAAENLDKIDDTIQAHLSEEWKLERIADVDRAILRVAIWEMLFNEEVPVTTAVVEAVEIASQYSTDEAPAYINAVLDSIAKNIDDVKAEASDDDSPIVEDVVELAEIITPADIEEEQDL